MDKPNLSSTLQFGYAPLSAYEFDKLLNDQDIIAALEHSVLYIIAKRPLIQFNNYKVSKYNRIISFDLTRKDVNTPLHCDFYIDKYPEFTDKELKIISGSLQMILLKYMDSNSMILKQMISYSGLMQKNSYGWHLMT